MKIRIDGKDLLRWSQRLDTKHRRVRGAMVSSLNFIGDKMVNEMAQDLGQQTGLNPEVLRTKIRVKRATRDDLTYNINAHRALLDEQMPRPMPRRPFQRRPDDFFRPGELVNIVTAGDDKVCPRCEALVERNPFTIEEARTELPHHPHCRCQVEPYRHRRELPVEVRPARGKVEHVSLRELSELLKRETRVAIKVG